MKFEFSAGGIVYKKSKVKGFNIDGQTFTASRLGFSKRLDWGQGRKQTPPFNLYNLSLI